MDKGGSWKLGAGIGRESAGPGVSRALRARTSTEKHKEEGGAGPRAGFLSFGGRGQNLSKTIQTKLAEVREIGRPPGGFVRKNASRKNASRLTQISVSESESVSSLSLSLSPFLFFLGLAPQPARVCARGCSLGPGPRSGVRHLLHSEFGGRRWAVFFLFPLSLSLSLSLSLCVQVHNTHTRAQLLTNLRGVRTTASPENTHACSA